MVGLLWSVLSLARLLAENPSGILVEKLGKRVAILLGLSIIASSYIIFLLAETVGLLFIAISLTGIGFVIAQMGTRIYLADIAPPGMRASYIGRYQVVAMSAGIFAPTIGGFVAETYGLLAPFFVSFLFACSSLSIALLKVKEPKRSDHLTASRKSVLESYGEILRSKLFLSLFGVSLLASFVQRFNMVVLPIYLSTNLQMSAVEVSLIRSVASLSQTLVRFSPLIPSSNDGLAERQ